MRLGVTISQSLNVFGAIQINASSGVIFSAPVYVAGNVKVFSSTLFIPSTSSLIIQGIGISAFLSFFIKSHSSFLITPGDLAVRASSDVSMVVSNTTVPLKVGGCIDLLGSLTFSFTDPTPGINYTVAAILENYRQDDLSLNIFLIGRKILVRHSSEGASDCPIFGSLYRLANVSSGERAYGRLFAQRRQGLLIRKYLFGIQTYQAPSICPPRTWHSAHIAVWCRAKVISFIKYS